MNGCRRPETSGSGPRVSLSCVAVGHTGIIAATESEGASILSLGRSTDWGFFAGDMVTVLADDPTIGLTIRTSTGIADVSWHDAEKIHVILETIE